MKPIDRDDVPKLLKEGQRVYVGGSSNEPHGLLDTLEQHPESAKGVTFIQQPLAALNKRDLSSLHDTACQETFFMTPFLREGLKQGKVKFIPMQMRAIYDYLQTTPLDVVLTQAARDRQGILRFGPNLDYVGAVMDRPAKDRPAKNRSSINVLEVNSAIVAPAGSPIVDESKVDYYIETDHADLQYPQTDIDETSMRIGEQIASLIKDGDCLQIGIGAVPAAIMSNLENKNDLGFHSGLINDDVMKLIQRANLTGSRKPIDKHIHITGMALGSTELMDWLANTPEVVFKSANYTHEVSVISQLDHFVSINSAVEVDLFGQVNAEVTGGKQISGTGGSVDFMRAARTCKDGRSIVALSSTARKGTVSRIVGKVEMVTALRTDVDIVVTEFGVADLRSASLDERAEALIAIAHPDFREKLRST